MAKQGKDSNLENKGAGKPKKKDGAHRISNPGRSSGKPGGGRNNGGKR